MNSDEVRTHEQGGVCPEVKLYSANDVISREARRIEVQENQELLISPADREFASSFARVQLESYRDLQILGFVPRKLAEEKVRHAIASDDDEVYKLAANMPHSQTRNCGCEGGARNTVTSRGSSLRSTYNSIRKSHNPALASLLSDHAGTRITWDSPLAGLVRKWSMYVQLRPEIIVLLLEDITINRNATLMVASSARSLLAHNIWIHRTGRLVQQGSYLKIWANSINQFHDFLLVAAVEAARKIAPPWVTS